MSTGPEPVITARRESCAVCRSGELETTLELPNFPLTGIYCRKPERPTPKGIDQQLLVCRDCGHAQLARQVNPALLYGDTYSFRASESATAQQGTDFFLRFLADLEPTRRFACALDLGCNDLLMLRRLEGRAERRVGIDPIWASQPPPASDAGITVIGATIEETDLGSVLDVRPDLILCRHTLEHIYEPRAVLQKLCDAAAKDALFLFEVPGFEALVRRLRFDQVFHQHLHYFSRASFQRLLSELSSTYISHRERYHDWGAMALAFRKNGEQPPKPPQSPAAPDVPAIRERYALFRRQAAALNDLLESLAGEQVYGYGAAQMLPALAYHLGNDMKFLTAVLDDDLARDGWYYPNLAPPILHSSKAPDLHSATVLLTAADNVKPILSKLFAQRPKHIVVPFNVF